MSRVSITIAGRPWATRTGMRMVANDGLRIVISVTYLAAP